MPELADVEVFRKFINAKALHQPIKHIHVENQEMLHDTTPQALGHALKDNEFDTTFRQGKYLFIAVTNSGWLVFHFGMSGSVSYFHKDETPPNYIRLLISFKNDNNLAYLSPRKLGKIFFIKDPREFIREHNLGPDALSLSESALTKLAEGQKGSVKSWLMDQTVMGGIGNIYSDEILFQSQIHPKTPMNELNKESLNKLYRNILHVFETAIQAEADPEKLPDDFLIPHRKPGGHCPRTHNELAKISFSGRSAWFCPVCQCY